MRRYGKAYRNSMVKIPVAFPGNPVNICIKNVTLPLSVQILSFELLTAHMI